MDRLRSALTLVVLSGILPLCLTAQADDRLSPEQKVEQWLQHRRGSSWYPGVMFVGCPQLAPDDSRALTLLLQREMNIHQRASSATQLSEGLKCGNERVETWFFSSIRRDIALGHGASFYWPLQDAISRANTPAVRSFLEEVYHDESIGRDHREWSGQVLFQFLTGDERTEEFIRGMHMADPAPIALEYAFRQMIRDDEAAAALGPIMATVRQNPDLIRSAGMASVVGQIRSTGDPQAMRQLRAELIRFEESPSVPAAYRAHAAELIKTLDRRRIPIP